MMEEEGENKGARISGVVTGFIDYTPQEQCLFHSFMEKVKKAYELFGFTPLHLRPFERMAALQGEGETQKQIFEVFRKDTQKTTSLGLPFDHTVPLALWVAEHAGHWQHLALPYKRYDMGMVYRGERPKTGRCRAFVQADVDIVGRKLPLSADAECLLAVFHALNSLSVGRFILHLNHLGVVRSVLRFHEIEEKEHAPLLRAIDKLDKLSKEEVLQEISRTTGLSSLKQKRVLDVFTEEVSLQDPSIATIYGPDAMLAIGEINLLITLLLEGGIPKEQIHFSLHRVRGLAYYTGVVFETFLEDKESYGSMASGGRYSNLVGDFAKGLAEVEGVGASIGITRLLDVLIKTGFVPPACQSNAQILVGARTEELATLAARAAQSLRAKGIRVDLYSGPCKVKQILGHADALGVPKAILVMDVNAFVLKEMHSKSQSEYSSIEALIEAL